MLGSVMIIVAVVVPGAARVRRLLHGDDGAVMIVARRAELRRGVNPLEFRATARSVPVLVSSRKKPALPPAWVQITWSPTENDMKAKVDGVAARSAEMAPPTWLTAVSICSVPTPAKVSLLATEPPLPSSSVPPLPASSRPPPVIEPLTVTAPPNATIVPELLVGPFSVSDPPALTVMVPALAAVPALVDARVPSTITPAPFDTLQGASSR